MRAIVWFFFKQSFWVTFWTAMAALLLHIFTDVFNSYGTKILWPLSQKRYAWDLLEVCDVYLLIVLAVGTAGGLFFSPIWSYIALGLLAGYIVLRFFLHKWAKSIAQKELPEEIWRIAVLPKLRAMKWNFIAISDDAIIWDKYACMRAKCISLIAMTVRFWRSGTIPRECALLRRFRAFPTATMRRKANLGWICATGFIRRIKTRSSLKLGMRKRKNKKDLGYFFEECFTIKAFCDKIYN